MCACKCVMHMQADSPFPAASVCKPHLLASQRGKGCILLQVLGGVVHPHDIHLRRHHIQAIAQQQAQRGRLLLARLVGVLSRQAPPCTPAMPGYSSHAPGTQAGTVRLHRRRSPSAQQPYGALSCCRHAQFVPACKAYWGSASQITIGAASMPAAVVPVSVGASCMSQPEHACQMPCSQQVRWCSPVGRSGCSSGVANTSKPAMPAAGSCRAASSSNAPGINIRCASLCREECKHAMQMHSSTAY